MLPKIRIISKKASSKSCSELNFVQRSPRDHMSTPWSNRTWKIDLLEILYFIERANYIYFRAQCCWKYASHPKKFQIKVVRNWITNTIFKGTENGQKPQKSGVLNHRTICKRICFACPEDEQPATLITVVTFRSQKISTVLYLHYAVLFRGMWWKINCITSRSMEKRSRFCTSLYILRTWGDVAGFKSE